MGKKPTEQALRDAKNEMATRFADQQKIGGVTVSPHEDHPAFHGNVVPDTRAIENYLAPLMRKTEVDLEEQKDAPPTESPEIVEDSHTTEENGIKTTVTHQAAGAYEWGLAPNSFRPIGNTSMPKRIREDVKSIAARHRVRFLNQLPEWRDRLQKALFSSSIHEERELKLYEILESSNRLFGDWRKPRAPRITIFGK